MSTDTAFNMLVRRDRLYRFRRPNSPSFEYVVGASFIDAATVLASAQIDVEILQFEGYLVTPLRKDVA